MSLLLDALKKAEQEKQKAREAEAGMAGDAQQPEQEIITDTPPDQQRAELAHEKETQVEEAEDKLELVMDEQPEENNLTEEPRRESDEFEVPKPQLSPPIEIEKSAATTSTVSDEALQLLVHKTNKKFRQKQKIIWGSLLSVSIIVLLTSGVYYYYVALEEVDALERKHRLAMRAVHAEPVKRQQSSMPAESLDSRAGVQKAQNKSKRVAAEKQSVNTVKPIVSVADVKRDFLIKKAKMEDPINALLNDAWLAYNKADYAVANRAYENVISREPKNRDALLGIAAVAVKTANYKKAKASYRLLLKLNPRDQIAMAAMSNIDELSSSSQDESKLKFMLQQQPTATHLNFALGNFYARKGQWPEAQSEYFKAWQGNSENADYIYNLAVSLDQLGKANEALRFYKESLMQGSQKNIGFSVPDVEKRIEEISSK